MTANERAVNDVLRLFKGPPKGYKKGEKEFAKTYALFALPPEAPRKLVAQQVCFGLDLSREML